MAYKYDPTIIENIKKLVGNLTNFEEGTEIFNYVHDHFLKSLYQIDTPVYPIKKEIDTKIESIADKFRFHGHFKAAETFTKLYHKLISNSQNKEILQNKLNVIQLLMQLSENPTKYLLSLPDGFESEVLLKDSEIDDWKEYLLDGIKWTPVYSDTESDGSEETLVETPSIEKVLPTEVKPIIKQKTEERTILHLYRTLQHSWWNDPYYRDIPLTNHPQATIALKWENYLLKTTHGLMGGPTNRILSEYKVLRELLWQQFGPHSSVVFAYNKNELSINESVTIASLRPFVFKSLMEKFLSDIMMLNELRTFHNRVLQDDNSPKTFWGYSEAVMRILRSAESKVTELETEVKNQETTMTIIKIGNRLTEIYQDVRYVHWLHSKVIFDYNRYPAHVCCMMLLTKLYNELFNVFEKTQMDIVLSLYMESVYTYIRIIQDWFRTDELFDKQNEFPLRLKTDEVLLCYGGNKKKEIFERTGYTIREIPEEMKLEIDKDPLLALIYVEVLKFARHIHLLKLLGKLNLLHGTSFSIYDEWKEELLSVLRRFFKVKEKANGCNDENTQNGGKEKNGRSELKPKNLCYNNFIQMTKQNCLKVLGKPKITNLEKYASALCKAFLMDAFEETPYENFTPIYEDITTLTNNTFPGVQFYLSDAIRSILINKYEHCGKILMDLFKTEYLIQDHIEVLSKVFLFKDDFIFPFYRKQFQKIEDKVNWGNDIWLTYELQDIIRDVHEELYENLLVGVKPGWQHLLEDPLKTCTLLDVKYKISWPIDIIITKQHEKMYREMFYFILKIKWALYTLNHLQYSRIQEKKRHQAPKCVKILLQRLEVLRFGFTNVFAALQHYILGFVWNMFHRKYQEDMESCNDLDSLIETHHKFLFGFHRAVARVRDYQEKSYGFDWALYSVRQLRKMWIAPGDVLEQGLRKIEEGLHECHKNLFEVISEHNVFE